MLSGFELYPRWVPPACWVCSSKLDQGTAAKLICKVFQVKNESNIYAQISITTNSARIGGVLLLRNRCLETEAFCSSLNY